MGMAADAEVIYGFDLGDMTDRDTYDSLWPRWWSDNGEDWGEWESVLAKKLGWEEAPFPANITYPDWRLPHEERKRIEAAQREQPEHRAWHRRNGDA